uniref:DUF4220 domain-containing protein n=1 Tax=Leersia perrieri TaxID=77586 RepID=A0A0D9XUU2_9ORYZ
MGDNEVCVVCVQQRCHPPTAQHSLVMHAQRLWNDWEIQCLVLVSFSLQVFLLFFAIFRRCHRSTVLSMLLWLAYLSADSVAIYLLGRLMLLVGDDPRHQLVLFWAPFLLLHLGGQETITAFSMEDCALWKRHLLNLATQVSLAIYVVGKQWQGDKSLVAPTTLMFVAGTTRYVERILALKRALSTTLESSAMEFYVPGDMVQFYIYSEAYYRKLETIISDKQDRNFKRIMEVATKGFMLSLDFLMDVTPPRPSAWYYGGKEFWIDRSSDNMGDMVYKLADIHLSLIYDYLYTKFGGGLMGVLCHLTTLALTCIALALFVVSRLGHKGSIYYDRNDVTISYILLVGAIALEILSALLWLMSSTLPHETRNTILYNILKHLCPESRVKWSGKLQQYNMIDKCIQQTQAGRLEQMMHRVGIERGPCTKPVKVSADVKKLILGKILAELSDTSTIEEELSLTRFHGKWAQRWVKRYYQDQVPRNTHASSSSSSSQSDRAQHALMVSQIQDLGFVSSAFLWHLVTDICLDQSDTTSDHSSNKLKSSSRELSNYVMYLLVECKAMLSGFEHGSLNYIRQQMLRLLVDFHNGQDDRRGFLSNLCNNIVHRVLDEQELDDVFRRAVYASSTLLKMDAASRWELIATVWAEMLCYIACNCGAGFHAKQLCAGGEFVTHVKMLLFILSFPVLVSYAQHLWNDWEIQCMVLVSFALQVFLLFSAVFRRRHRSVVLSVLLWLAYLSADSVAVYLLGRLTLLVGDDTRHQLVLFWAPFLLLHLGGQETITAFSMEDCALWKRHLLNLATQVSLVIYIVGRQWRGDKQLVAPTVLIFVAGTTRYADRILALRRAQSSALGIRHYENCIRGYTGIFEDGIEHQSYTSTNYYQIKLGSIISNKQERNFERVMEVANIGSSLSIYFFMDLIRPRTSYLYEYTKELWSEPAIDLQTTLVI